MAHSSNLIHSIKIGNNTYEVHDKEAIHTLADLAALGIDIEGAFIYKGSVANKAALPTTGNKIGYVYHVVDEDQEYVWAKIGEGNAAWEEFGAHLSVDHIHDVTVTGHNEASSISGNATITGSNASSSVTGSASIDAPKVSAEAIYTKVSTNNDTFVKSYPGATSKMVTTSITPAGTATSVVSSVTPTPGSVTGVSGTTKVSKATKGTAVNVAKAGSAVAIPNVTGNTSVTASKVTKKTVVTNAVVSEGVLTISFGDSVSTTDVIATNTTLGTDISVTPAVSNGSITPYTFAEVDVAVADTKATDFVASISTDTSASLVAGTSSNGFHTGDDVTVDTETISGTISGTAAAQIWTQNTGTISGTAAAQKWTQDSGVTGEPEAN